MKIQIQLRFEIMLIYFSTKTVLVKLELTSLIKIRNCIFSFYLICFAVLEFDVSLAVQSGRKQHKLCLLVALKNRY